MKQKRICKFCGNYMPNISSGDTCHECTRYCMENCKEASSTKTSWHKEPCVSCTDNPYAKLHKWEGEKWVKN